MLVKDSFGGLAAVFLLALFPAAAEARDSGGRAAPEIPHSLREAVIESAYRVTQGSEDCAWKAANPAQRMHSTFTGEGVQLEGEGWSLGLSLEAWGRRGSLDPLEAAESVVAGRYVEYRRGPITEWYLNDERGLEQGFTVETSPEGEGALWLVLSIGGGLSAEVLPSGRDALFVDRERGVVLHYTGLRAWDAMERELAASIVAAGDQLSIRVEDDGAVYPVQIDPWITTEEAKLTASDGEPVDYFGNSVSLSGDTALVGAYGDDHAGGTDAGSAYVFIRDGTSWTDQTKLTASDATAKDDFGFSVSLWNDTAVIGARGDDHSGVALAGSAYVFVRGGATWTEQAKLTASDPAYNALFGSSVSVSGDTALIGAKYGDQYAGAAYVFVRTGTTWTEQAKLTASDAAISTYFGSSVSVSGDTALVGASSDDHAAGFDAGSAYVFVRNGSTWTEQAKLTASDSATSDVFGSSVSLSGDTAVVGAPKDDHAGGFDAGSAYVFVRSGTTWTEQAKLTASDAADDDFFGNSISLSGGTVVIGAHRNDFEVGVNAGSAYVFARSGTSWSEEAELTASDPSALDKFGFEVSLSGDTALVGANGDDLLHAVGAGSAYVFRLWPPPTAYCTAGTSASGCQAALSASGTASASATSGFALMATNVEGAKDGLFYFGTNGKQANPWGAGYQCVVPPVVRTGLLRGSGTAGQCDGSFSLDLNALWCPTCPNPQKNPGVGAFVQVQLWYRDPLSPSHQTTNLSDAIEFFVVP